MPLSREDITRISRTYQNKLKEFGSNSAQALHWQNEFTQFTRFKILSQIADLDGKSILDVGCGLGDLYLYLNARFKGIKYTGIDIVPEMTAAAVQKYPGVDFQNKEIWEFETGSFDFVLASGIFSHRIDDYEKKYFEIIKQLFDVATKGAAFNMLDRAGHPADDLFVTYDPGEILAHCKTFAPKTELIQGYLPYDFTIYLYH